MDEKYDFTPRQIQRMQQQEQQLRMDVCGNGD
jgi:hypothetical protein